MKKFDSKRKGFTLVELLIVIVVIGILSAMMMLSSSEAVSSARATTIVADLRNIKTAVLAYYTDHIDTADTTATPTMDLIKPYLTSGKEVKDDKLDGYALDISNNGWFVKYTISGTNVDKIKTKLVGRAASTGLLKEAKVPTTSDTRVYAGGDTVFMYVR
ncbi:MAG: type II secretion system protein [Synergistaceae bacterium]|nr:type II secretion system protein [Synergistaceae bacterium]